MARAPDSSTADDFTYVLPPPRSPKADPKLEGPRSRRNHKSAITGTGFTAGSTVSFGATKAKATTFISATELSAESPAGTGTVNVTVTERRRHERHLRGR